MPETTSTPGSQYLMAKHSHFILHRSTLTKVMACGCFGGYLGDAIKLQPNHLHKVWRVDSCSLTSSSSVDDGANSSCCWRQWDAVKSWWCTLLDSWSRCHFSFCYTAVGIFTQTEIWHGCQSTCHNIILLIKNVVSSAVLSVTCTTTNNKSVTVLIK